MIAQRKSIEAASLMPPGFVCLADVAPAIIEDMRYAGPDNFTGRPAAGYDAPIAWARDDLALAVRDAAEDAARLGFRIVVHDCYRPQRASDHFHAWSLDASDILRKPDFYPRVDKRDLFDLGYLSRQSGHSAGVAIDLTLVRQNGEPVDFGTQFDFFDEASWTESELVAEPARRNRLLLRSIMGRHGLVNYIREWWHYSLAGVSDPPLFDVPVFG